MWRLFIKARVLALPFLAAVLLLLTGSDPAMASGSYLTAFNSLYGGSTSGTNASCNICHSSGGGTDLNGYGKDWAVQHNTGLSSAAAFQAIQNMNSDGDPTGATNLAEINANAQPGWTPGPHNTLYNLSGTAVTASNQNPPSITGNVLDPAAAANRPPVLTNPGNQTATEGVLKTFPISATDPDGGTLTFSSGNLPTGAALTSAGTFSWTPSFTQGSTTPYPVTITVTDAGGLTASQNFTITVGNVNRPPAFTGAAVGNQTATEGVLKTIAFSASDPDGGTLTFSGSLPSGASLTPGTNNSATFSWTPSSTQGSATPYPVTITVTDAGGLTASQSFTITVGNANQPPVLNPNPVGNQTATEGVLKTIAFSASDPDGGTLTFSGSLPSGASLTPGANNTATFSWTPSFTQGSTTAYPVTITVTDAGGLTASQSFTITVGNVNRPPTLSPSPVGNRTVTAGQPLTIAFNGSDPDGDLLTFSSSTLPTGAGLVAGSNNIATFSWTPTTAQASSTPYPVTITVTDPSGQAASQSFTITVTAAAPAPVNRPPTMTNPGNKTVTADQLLSFTVTGSDPDGNPLTYAATSALPSGASLSPSGAFAWTPTTAQASATPYSVTVTARDNGNPALTSAPVTFTITVTAAAAPAPVNRPPTMTNPGNKTVTAGQLLSFTVTGSDPDGNPLTYAATSALPSGASLSPSGAFAWTPTTAQASATPYSVTVTARDNGNPALTSAPVTFTITVNTPTPPPTTGGTIDFDIVSFRASREVELRERTSVRFQLVVSNVGSVTGGVPATLVGMQNGVEVYRKTLTATAVTGKGTSLVFPSYTPKAGGNITWTVTLQDQGPAQNTATATTQVEGGGGRRSGRERD